MQHRNLSFTLSPAGGWLVHDVRYPSGQIGHVYRGLDGKWRIVHDDRVGDHTYATRYAAAVAEWSLARSLWQLAA